MSLANILSNRPRFFQDSLHNLTYHNSIYTKNYTKKNCKIIYRLNFYISDIQCSNYVSVLMVQVMLLFLPMNVAGSNLEIFLFKKVKILCSWYFSAAGDNT